jgi:hypothetical protein
VIDQSLIVLQQEYSMRLPYQLISNLRDLGKQKSLKLYTKMEFDVLHVSYGNGWTSTDTRWNLGMFGSLPLASPICWMSTVFLWFGLLPKFWLPMGCISISLLRFLPNYWSCVGGGFLGQKIWQANSWQHLVGIGRAQTKRTLNRLST